MMWVKLTLPPRVRARWLFRTLRLTSSSRAGTTRKDVAVGTPSDASMFTAVRRAAPRSGLPTEAGAGAGLAGLAGGAGGEAAGWAGWAAWAGGGSAAARGAAGSVAPAFRVGRMDTNNPFQLAPTAV